METGEPIGCGLGFRPLQRPQFAGIYLYAKPEAHSGRRPIPEEGKMEQIIAKLLHEFEQGKLSRRDLIKNLTVAATAVAAAATASAAITVA